MAPPKPKVVDEKVEAAKAKLKALAEKKKLDSKPKLDIMTPFQKFVAGQLFDTTIILAIILNCVWMAITLPHLVSQ